MPNLEELLPFFQQLFQQWSTLTQVNGPYAITMGLLVWLVTAIGYSISIWFLKMRLARELKAKLEALNGLESAQQQVQAIQEQVTAYSAELEQLKQELASHSERASTLEQKLTVNSKKLGTAVAGMLEKFELLDNAPAPQAGDIEGLWQRFDSILSRVGERFLGEQQAKARLQLDIQAEKSKLADKDAEVAVLQRRVDLQGQKLTELEQSATELATLKQELETQKQRLLIAHDQHRTDSLRIAELEKFSSQPAAKPAPSVIAEAKPMQQPEPEPVMTAAVAEAVVAEEKPATKPVTEPIAPVSKPEPVAAAVKSAPSKPASKWSGMFGNAMEKFSKLDEKLGSPTTVKVTETINQPEIVEPVVSEAPVETTVEPVVSAAPQAKAGGFGGKLGGMLGGLKKAPAPTPETVAPVVEASAESVAETPKKAGKLGGLLGKFKK